MKMLSDEEYIEYMNEHYIKNNENRNDIMKDLGISEYQFYKRNKELNIHRENKVIPNKSNKKKYKYNLLFNRWERG